MTSVIFSQLIEFEKIKLVSLEFPVCQFCCQLKINCRVDSSTWYIVQLTNWIIAIYLCKSMIVIYETNILIFIPILEQRSRYIDKKFGRCDIAIEFSVSWYFVCNLTNNKFNFINITKLVFRGGCTQIYIFVLKFVNL